MPNRLRSRRAFLAGIAASGGVALGGCLGAPGTQQVDTPTRSSPDDVTDPPVDDEARFADLYQATIDAVAMVRPVGPQGPIGQGSGFIRPSGHIVTNEHVVAGADEIQLQFRENRWATGTIVGADRQSDLAVIESHDLPEEVVSLPPADRRPTIGQEVIALGNPFGLEESVSQGIISGTNRTLPTGTGFRIPATIQTDASVNPGNSGGPLVSMRARYLGVITARQGADIGFAISWQLVERVVPSLIDHGRYDHPFLGIATRQVGPDVATANDLERPRGVIVDEVLADSPSWGILQGSMAYETVRNVQVPVGGDVIIELDGRPIETTETLSTVLALHTAPGDEIDITIIRDGDIQTVTVELGIRPTL